MTYEITYTGKGISLNGVKSLPWRVTEANKNRLKEAFGWLIIIAKMKHMKRYRIEAHYNSRLDPTNIAFMVKIYEDAIKKAGLIPEDNKKFCRGINLLPDETLPPNTYKFIISEV